MRLEWFEEARSPSQGGGLYEPAARPKGAWRSVTNRSTPPKGSSPAFGAASRQCGGRRACGQGKGLAILPPPTRKQIPSVRTCPPVCFRVGRGSFGG